MKKYIYKKASKGNQALKSLLSYLSMSEIDKKEELVNISEYIIKTYSSFLEKLQENDNVNSSIKEEVSHWIEDEDTYIYDLSNSTKSYILTNLTDKDVDYILGSIEPSETPLFNAAYLLSPKIQEGWLIHKTDFADDIVSRGFKYGVENMYQLALTTHLGAYHKKNPGYNFAFTLKDYEKLYDKRKYGKEIVLLHAEYVYIYHNYDEERQAIFWGKDASHICEVIENYDGYTVILDDEEVQADTLDELTDLLD